VSLFVRGSAGERFGDVVRTRVAGDFVLRLSSYRGGLLIPAHHHPDAYFSHVVRGGVRESCAGDERCYEPGSLHFHPPREPHVARMSPAGATCLSIIPGGAIAERIASVRDSSRLPIAAMGRHAARCHHEFRADDDASALSLEAAALELVATWLRDAQGARASRRPEWVDAVRAHLAAHYAEPVTLRELARLAGVHEVYLVRGFRRHVGRTPGSFLRELRVEAARAALLDPTRSIADVALAAGFSSQAHLTRVFRRELGLPPAAYRRLHQRAAP
jgi:AraC family transcriptional regulator